MQLSFNSLVYTQRVHLKASVVIRSTWLREDHELQNQVELSQLLRRSAADAYQ